MISKEISSVQGSGVQGSGDGGASRWKAAAQAATRSGLGGDSYYLFLLGVNFDYFDNNDNDNIWSS